MLDFALDSLESGAANLIRVVRRDDDDFEKALADTERLTGLSLADITRIGQRRVVAEFEEKGFVTLTNKGKEVA